MKTINMDKIYNPRLVEDKWYNFWLDNDLFRAVPSSKKSPFTMVIPPPNITGSLHMGHALNNTLQDILARYKRMDGFNVLWLPGTDHAGIATQNVVEREIHKEGIDRHAIGRELFEKKVWEWKERYGGVIIHQLKRLGATCDWSRERFTMDDGLAEAVKEVFIRLYHEELIYRGDYMINWCPRCHTALSDLEVEHQEIKGSLYHIRYPLHTGGDGVTIATTRPETMLGDTAVAVHPDDKRYTGLKGKNLLLPIADRRLPVITDQYVDPLFGTGALKITPAHDPNDFEIGQRHGLPQVTVIGKDGRMTEEAGRPFAGMDRFKCREEVIKRLKEEGYLTRVEEYDHTVGHCYRCKTVVEPLVSLQWFVKTAPLAGPAIKAVKDGRVSFTPRGWGNTYFEWMENIKDWCISRQIWWGHRIPAWYCVDCSDITDPSDIGKEANPIVSAHQPESCPECGGHDLIQDQDVLDTWFSSALWPFSTMGWPHETDDLRGFYPTSVLVTGFDIIFFWVARMIMMGLKFMGDVPFSTVYIHALVRDAEGQKMSKSKGNVIDPLIIMDKYGTDALRFTLAAFAAQGRDIKLSEERIEGYRNFCNKIWNVTRFALMNIDDLSSSSAMAIDPESYSLHDRWILTRLNRAIEDVRRGLDGYYFNDAANAVYRFVWHEFCDWYIEIVKPDLNGEMGEHRKQIAQGVLLRVLRDSLRLLHPFMPFISEEIWSIICKDGGSIIISPFPELVKKEMYEEAEGWMNRAIGMIRAVRNFRSEHRINPSTYLKEVFVQSDDRGFRDVLKENEDYIMKLSRISSLSFEPDADTIRFSTRLISDSIELFVPFSSVPIAMEDEKERLEKKRDKIQKNLWLVQKKLSNNAFLSKAPPDIIAKQKAKAKELSGTLEKIKDSIEKVTG
ncbi:MAG: valine--tRNA ligase [Thermodesulfobacteriota bacterium]